MMPRPNHKEDVFALLLDVEAMHWPPVEIGTQGTVEYIAGKIGINAQSVRRHLRHLCAEGRAHIGRRNPTGGKLAPVWFAGPAPKTTRSAQRSAAPQNWFSALEAA
jgi:hypothetical protein